jgi:outer membrane receptor protein involved in Fe transport
MVPSRRCTSFYELGLSVSKFSGEVIPKFSSARTSSNEVDDISLTMDFTYTFTNMNELGVGFHVKQINTSLFYENDRDIKTDLGSSGTNIVFYLKYKLASLEFLKADIGFRLNAVPIVKSKTSKFFEPRINLNIKPFGWLSLKGSAGLIQQEMTTITDENEIISIYEPWVLAPDYLPLSYSLFYIFGFQINPSPEFEFDVEGYYKNAKGLSYINEGKITFLDRDFISGNSESYGVESALNYMLGSATFTSSYTLAYAFKEINGLVYAPKYDVRHSVNLGLEYDFGNDWQVSTRWTYSSGLPFTQIVGYYDKLYFDDLTTPWNQYDPRNPYVILGVQNLGRLPSYHRLDFSISKKFIINPVKIDIGFSVINLYDRKNIFYFKRDTGERVDMLPVLPSVTLRVEI